MPRQTADSAEILLGVVVGAHGLKGEVKVKTFTAAPESLGAYGPLIAEDGRRFEVANLRGAGGDQLVVRFKGIADRNSAESLKGVHLSVPRAALPEISQDEFYHADLIGLAVQDKNGKALGTVKGIHNFGAGDVIEILGDDGESRFFPFSRDAVPVVDIAGRRVVIDAPEET